MKFSKGTGGSRLGKRAIRPTRTRPETELLSCERDTGVHTSLPIPAPKSRIATSIWRQEAEADMAPKPDMLAFVFGTILAAGDDHSIDQHVGGPSGFLRETLRRRLRLRKRYTGLIIGLCTKKGLHAAPRKGTSGGSNRDHPVPRELAPSARGPSPQQPS